MIALKILGVIAIVIFLICLIPIGADIAYESGELVLSAKVCGVLLQLYPKEASGEPAKPKRKKEKSDKENTQADSDKPPKKKLKLDFSRDEILALLKTVLKGLGKFRKIKVDRFLLHWLCAGYDPCETAELFGFVNAALCMLDPICTSRFTVKDCSVKTAIDFTRERMQLDFGVALSIRIGQIFAVINTILFGALWILIKHKVIGTVRKVQAKLTHKQSEDAEKLSAPDAAENTSEIQQTENK